jgi:hypothetical protein
VRSCGFFITVGGYESIGGLGCTESETAQQMFVKDSYVLLFLCASAGPLIRQHQLRIVMAHTVIADFQMKLQLRCLHAVLLYAYVCRTCHIAPQLLLAVAAPTHGSYIK